MSFNFSWMIVAVIVILAVSLLYTWRLTRQHNVAAGELDSKLPETVKVNAYSRNPIFISYGIFFAALLLIVIAAAVYLNM